MNFEKLNRWLTLGANLGVFVGLILLIAEMEQNSNLMRAQTHSARAQAKAGRQMDMANNGVLNTIRAKAADAGFPNDPNALVNTTTEEILRLRDFYNARIDMIANWHFQCQQGLSQRIPALLCNGAKSPGFLNMPMRPEQR